MEIIHDLDSFGPRPYPVLALGNFDGVHIGHRAILKEAIARARNASGSAYALTFDPLPAKRLFPDRAPPTLVTLDDKLELLRAAGLDGVLVIDFTLELSRVSATEFVRDYLLGKIGARAVVVGHSVSFGHKRAGNAAAMVAMGREFGFDTVVVGPVTTDGLEVSSTKIRELIGAGDVKLAARLLGRHHFLSGSVVHGRARGRKLGFPTANLASDTECIPPDGVYATRVVLPGGTICPSVSNIGKNPTFDEAARTIEAYLFDFDRDLYGERIKLEFVERIRGELKFESPQALASQIASDLARAREILARA
ncbi:MAG TPA: bifunctional riboflavin kinase/FAD synthetase [Candidatus Binataceae bacterium]|nr:bifunctional riboflavin kinase/FAD synthetase [Candidatus Binataceae bacterium]